MTSTFFRLGPMETEKPKFGNMVVGTSESFSSRLFYVTNGSSRSLLAVVHRVEGVSPPPSRDPQRVSRLDRLQVHASGGVHVL